MGVAVDVSVVMTAISWNPAWFMTKSKESPCYADIALSNS